MRKKRELERFARFCFGRLNLLPIKIHFCNANCLVDPAGNFCSGCYAYTEDGPRREKSIWLAYGLPKWECLQILAHEIWHYKREVDGRIAGMSIEEAEKEAEEASGELVKHWLLRGGKIHVKG